MASQEVSLREVEEARLAGCYAFFGTLKDLCSPAEVNLAGREI